MLFTKWDSANNAEELDYLTTRAQRSVAALIEEFMDLNGSLLPGYQKFLSANYHLTRGVQKQFFRFASSPRMEHEPALRRIFMQLPETAAMHFVCAAEDLQALDMETLPEPLDAALWRSYFECAVDSRPFLRIGAALVLENALAGQARPAVRRALGGAFMTERNTALLRLMQRASPLTGAPLVEAISLTALTEAETADLAMGVRQGTVLYLRVLNWAFSREEHDISPAEDRIMFERYGVGEPRRRLAMDVTRRIAEQGGPDSSFRRRCPYMA